MSKKTAIITGASRGIGRATATLFAQNGYNVVINYCNSEKDAVELQNALCEHGFSCMAIKADVSNEGQVKNMFLEAEQTFGNIDVLVNNAGIAKQQLFTDVSYEEWQRMLDVNVSGVFNCCQCALPGMIRRHSGKIINVSSIWGIVGASCEVTYSTTKAAIIGLTKALAKEVGPSNINVNCVAPGVIDTEMNSTLDEQTIAGLKDETPLCKIGSPMDIANTILFLASDRASFITGQVISPNGGFVI